MLMDTLISIETLLNDFGRAEQILEKHGYAVIISDNEPKYVLSKFPKDDNTLLPSRNNTGIVPPDREQLTRLLNGIGQRVFVTYLNNFINNEDPTLFMACEGYTPNSIRSRSSKVRTIIRNGWVKDALILITDSIRTDYATRKQAKDILASLCSDIH